MESEKLEEDEQIEESPEDQPELDPAAYLEALLQKARQAMRPLSSVSTVVKNKALFAMAAGLEEQSEQLLVANAQDLEAFAEKQGNQALADRLTLTPERITEMANGIRTIAALRDPVGESLGLRQLPNGMQVGRIRVPIGVIGIVYESRPNVTADAAALCLKSGNVCVLRGGSEAIHSNTAIAEILSTTAQQAGIPDGAISFIERTERETVIDLLKQDAFIDLIIPRGGGSLMETVTTHATIPVIKHDKGVCHIFVDADADLDMARKICFNAKVQRPSTCNAVETLLVHQSVARPLLEELGKQLVEAKVEIRGCRKTCSLVPEAQPASEDDYGQEFLSLIVSIKVVKDIDQAMAHIERYGSCHTEAIVTKNYSRAMRFLREVDASAVMVNASTRLNDGYQFGLGAEIGISTTRIHARGPMGLEDLTCAKYIVQGAGQIRE
ncbi:MAG: glutamate-5-semialdehyde dehydrogenase [Nitrospirales bacterium]|nr:glutamate-5-semialdehyde dehydrogenase [Nitrospirales bacterium]